MSKTFFIIAQNPAAHKLRGFTKILLAGNGGTDLTEYVDIILLEAQRECNFHAVEHIVQTHIVDAPANLYTAEPGDILQYAAFDTWVHTVVVADLLYDDDGDVADMLINSNTTERIDFPASAYGYSTMRLIRILGDNG